MSGGDTEPTDASVVRPTGFVQPEHDRARRALVALQDERLADAETNITAIGDDTDANRAWACYLTGRLAARREQVGAAIEQFQTCCAVTREQFELSRLEAASWECLGVLHRRREESVQAAEAHDRAYRLRLEVGSAEECWESAHSLALTEGLRGRRDQADQWFGEALRWAQQIPDGPDRYRAMSLAARAELELQAARMPQAVQAARQALDAQCRYNRGGVDAVRAELSLGHVLLRAAESLLATDPAGASDMLDEARERLQSARDGLLAFGLNADPDSRWCDELLDFAGRLRVEL